jgi:hypothetical protein
MRGKIPKMREAMKAFGVEEATLFDLNQVLNSDDFRTWSEGKSGLHWPQSNYAPISSRLTPATTLGLALYYLRTFGCPRLKITGMKEKPSQLAGSAARLA